jgi:hypothetical protein
VFLCFSHNHFFMFSFCSTWASIVCTQYKCISSTKTRNSYLFTFANPTCIVFGSCFKPNLFFKRTHSSTPYTQKTGNDCKQFSSTRAHEQKQSNNCFTIFTISFATLHSDEFKTFKLHSTTEQMPPAPVYFMILLIQ